VSRLRHVVGVGLVGLGLLAAATLLDGWLPEVAADAVADPFVRSAAVGEPVELRTLSLEVDSVRGARAIDEFGSELRSPGVWVVVTYTVVAARENAGIGFAEVRDGRGRVWTVQHGRGQNTCPASPPGVRNGCVALFEVPPDAVPSLRLRLSPTIEQRFDSVAEIDLGLTAEDAEDFADVTALEVPGTTLGGR
jgi:hypothetical protein